jgi:hypothetical protein
MQQGTPVHFVFPGGFKGPVRLVLDPSAGEDITPTNGQIIYAIPADGLLRVKSFEPFRGWHKQTANYEDGTVIPNEYETWVGVVFHGGGESSQPDRSPEMSWLSEQKPNSSIGTVADCLSQNRSGRNDLRRRAGLRKPAPVP